MPQLNNDQVAGTLPRYRYSPVHADEELEDPRVPLMASNAQTRRRRSIGVGTGILGTVKAQIGSLFHSLSSRGDGGVTGWTAILFNVTKFILTKIFRSPIFFRGIQLVLIMTFVVSSLIIVKYLSKPPRWLEQEVDFKQLPPFNVSELIANGTQAAVWEAEKGLLGLPGGEPVEGGYSVFMEMHTHTIHSDGSMSPEQVVDWAIAYGFNALVVSDHNTLSGALAAQEYANRVYNTKENTKILVIPGIEYTTCRIHMNLIGLNKPIPAPTAAFPSDEELASVIKQAHDQGGLAIVNHLPWSLSTEHLYNQPTIRQHPSREDLLSWGIDAFEILHERTLDLPTLLFARKHNMPLITSTDLHGPEDVPHGWTVMRDTPLTIPAILDRLREGKSGIVHHPIGIGKTVLYPRENPAWDKWAPLASMDFGFLYDDHKGMYSFTGEFCHERRFEVHSGRAVWFVTWVLLAWGGYELVRWCLGVMHGIAKSGNWGGYTSTAIRLD